MVAERQEETHLLIVTGPMRDRLFDRFSRLYATSSDVRVLKDRRYGERRRTVRPPAEDHRASDRRAQRGGWVFPSESV